VSTIHVCLESHRSVLDDVVWSRGLTLFLLLSRAAKKSWRSKADCNLIANRTAWASFTVWSLQNRTLPAAAKHACRGLCSVRAVISVGWPRRRPK
jgi:hypothetical protein